MYSRLPAAMASATLRAVDESWRSIGQWYRPAGQTLECRRAAPSRLVRAYPERGPKRQAMSKGSQKGICDDFRERARGQSRHGAGDVLRLWRSARGIDLHAGVEGNRAVEVPDRRGGQAGKRLPKAAAEAAPGVARDVRCGPVADDRHGVFVVAGPADREAVDAEWPGA